MKRKEPVPSVVVTFHTTAEAMATEKLCCENAIPGKLMSAPRELSADCGISWVSPASQEESLRRLLSEAPFEVEGIYLLNR